MHADIHHPIHRRSPFWLERATLAFSLLTVVWVAFVR